MRTIHDHRLEQIERYYDCVPRSSSTPQQCGPFTIFAALPGTGWQLYARPTLGAGKPFEGAGQSMGSGQLEAVDVERVLARQVELGVPQAIEWVDEVTPSLTAAVKTAGYEPQRYPLLALNTAANTGRDHDPDHDPDPRARTLHASEPLLALAVGAVSAGFHERDDIEPRETGIRPLLIERGDLVVVASFEGDRLCGAGSAAPRGDVAELMGIAVPPGHRHRGHGTAITRSLVNACSERDVGLVFLSAGSDAAAEIYRRVGFTDVGTACILTLTG